jgi:serine/threonine protein kinase
MDLCWFDLKKVIDLCEVHFDTGGNQLFPGLGYYILSELLLEIVESIEFLHNSNVIHRDIKPTNILIRAHKRDGRFIKLGDFGLAVSYERDSQSHSREAGTQRYMAPEVRNSRIYNSRADLYSLGITIQEMFHFKLNRLILSISFLILFLFI